MNRVGVVSSQNTTRRYVGACEHESAVLSAPDPRGWQHATRAARAWRENYSKTAMTCFATRLAVLMLAVPPALAVLLVLDLPDVVVDFPGLLLLPLLFV